MNTRLAHFSLIFFFAFGYAITSLAQVEDPVPEPILPSGILLELEDLLTIPASSSAKPYTRINLLREAPDGTSRLFVNDLRGPFWIIADGEPQLYADLSEVFPFFIDAPGKGTGFGAFAFHPEFTENGLFYTSHAESAGVYNADYSPIVSDEIAMQWVITEWQATDPAANAFSGIRTELLRVDYPSALHGIQDISFNPTAQEGDTDYGMLYICLGDGGASLNFQEENLQTLYSYMGTIMRIDPLGNNSPNGHYGIPADNPFAGDTDPLTLEEVYAYGFRNPHRICWDTEGDHKMLVGDIGEKNIEEVNLVLPGHNYGWSVREGTFLYDRSEGREYVFELPPDDEQYGYTYPVAQFDHDEGVAIVGGYIYRGDALPMLAGHYIFGDIPSGKVFHLPADELMLGTQTPMNRLAFVDADYNPTNLLQLVDHDRADLRFGTDRSGKIYLLTKADGKIRQMKVPASTATEGPAFRKVQSWLQPNPGTGVFQVETEGIVSTSIKMSVWNAEGQRVWQQVIGTKSAIDLTALPAGSYWAHWQLEGSTETFVQTFIKL